MIDFQKQINSILIIAMQGKVGGMSESELTQVDILGLNDSIVKIQGVDSKDMPLLYNAADILLLPSLDEGFGFPLVEAMASGCVVIASNRGAIPEVVGDVGLLAEPYDVNKLANYVIRVLQDRDLKDRLIQSGLRRAKDFSWEQTARETFKVYEKVLFNYSGAEFIALSNFLNLFFLFKSKCVNSSLREVFYTGDLI